MNKQQLIDQAVNDFRLLVWGIAPEGTRKDSKGKEIENFLSKQIVAAYAKGREDERKEQDNGKKEDLSEFDENANQW